MQTASGQTRRQTQSWSGDVWGGLAAMLVALPSSIAFGVLVYSALGPEFAAQGAMAGAIGAAALGLVASLIGRTRGLISAPCAPAAAVLSALVLGLLGGRAGNPVPISAVPSLLTLTVLLSATLQFLYGLIRAGRLIKFIPYPVVNGYLSGVAVIIVLGQLPKLFGFTNGSSLVQGLLSPQHWLWQSLVVGLVTMVIMVLSPRLTTRIPAGILGLAGGLITYFALSLVSPHLLTLDGNRLVIGQIHASGGFLKAVLAPANSLLSLDPANIRLILIPALTLSLLLSIDTLKTCVILDVLTRSRHNSNRELIGQGFGNLAACLAGGMPGAGAMGPTLVNVSSGGRTPRAGSVEALLVVLVLVAFGSLMAWVPVGALAGLMIVVAFKMFDWSMFRLLRYPAGRLDFAVIAGVIIVAVTVDLIAASGVGIAFAILLFIRDQVRSSVIRRKIYLNQISSKTHRLAAEREILARGGDQAVFCELQGNLFFGTTDQLFSHLEPDLRTKRFFLFDMRRVQSCDYTAAHLFDQIQAQLKERGGQLLFSGMPSAPRDRLDLQLYLSQLGVVREDAGVIISDTLDGALEWMEERILQAAGAGQRNDEQPLEVKDFDLFRGMDAETLDKLAACSRVIRLGQGDKLFSAGDAGDEVFLVRRGTIRILLPLDGGKVHHLATFGRGDFFGELAFLDRGKRSANAVAKVETDLYALSRVRFDKEIHSDPSIGVQVFAHLALAIVNRLREADAELRVLQER